MVLRLRYSAPNEWDKAKCKDVEVSREYDPFSEEDEEAAMDFCNGTYDDTPCPIRNECLLFALTNNEKYGVWGGTNEITRKAIRKRWPLVSGKEPRPEWEWMTESQALEGLDVNQLKKEPDEDESLRDD